jgi:hypothetical protein
VASLAAQRTALGIVLNGTRVDATVPGSPAHVCGMIDKGDELVMVDGHKVTAVTAMPALRGSDSPGSVVTLVLRKSRLGEMNKVYLPRMSIDLVQRRQELNEGLEELQDNVMHAIAKGDESQAKHLLGNVASQARALDRINFELQLQLCAQKAALVEDMETVVGRAKTWVLDVDATHQQVHVLQSLTETELRQLLVHESRSLGNNAERESMLQRQVQELEGDLKALQEELSSSQMLRRECIQDINQLQQKVQELEHEIRCGVVVEQHVCVWCSGGATDRGSAWQGAANESGPPQGCLVPCRGRNVPSTGRRNAASLHPTRCDGCQL